MILDQSQIADVMNANSALQAAQNARWEYCKKIFRPGTVIYWLARGYRQSGIVQNGVIGSPWHPRIRTLNSGTRKVVDVDLYLIDWDAMKSQADSFEKFMKEVGE